MRDDQDNRASIPPLLRWIISTLYPAWVMQMIDRHGASHDRDSKLTPELWRINNRQFIFGLWVDGCPLWVLLTIWLGVAVYWRIPARLQRLYWRLIS